MSTRLRLVVAAVAVVSMTGCGLYVAPVIPAQAAIFSNTRAPLDIEYDETRLGSKVGRASTTSVLGFAWGDASIATAAADGKITTIRHADYEYLNVFFGIFSSFTTVVYGD